VPRTTSAAFGKSIESSAEKALKAAAPRMSLLSTVRYWRRKARQRALLAKHGPLVDDEFVNELKRARTEAAFTPFCQDGNPAADAPAIPDGELAPIHSPLTGDTTIRLLLLQPAESQEEIACRLVIKDLGDSIIPYEALSYVWGTSDPASPHMLYCDGQAFRIDVNLRAALHGLRPKKGTAPRVLWIDAVCINQADAAEKARQVQMMQRIYARAARVVMWLGEDSSQGSLAPAAFRRVCRILDGACAAGGPAEGLEAPRLRHGEAAHCSRPSS